MLFCYNASMTTKDTFIYGVAEERGIEEDLILASAEYPIRSHSLSKYRKVVEKLLEVDSSEDSFRIVSEQYAQGSVEFTEAVGLQPSQRELDRSWYGYGESSGAPISYYADVIGPNKEDYIRNSAAEIFDFLTFPGQKPARIGAVIDNQCKHCYFGGGKGGFHCRTFLSGRENDVAESFIKDTRSYLSLPEIRQRARNDPERYRWTSELVFVEDPLRVKQLNPNDGEMAFQIQMPLGLVRDVLTYSFTRYNANKYLSFQELVQARGIPRRQNRVS